MELLMKSGEAGVMIIGRGNWYTAKKLALVGNMFPCWQNLLNILSKIREKVMAATNKFSRRSRVLLENLTICLRSTNSLILFGIRKNCLISGRSLLLYQFTKRVIKLTVIIIVGYHCYQFHTTLYRISSSQG
jgi:hypothetical protein